MHITINIVTHLIPTAHRMEPPPIRNIEARYNHQLPAKAKQHPLAMQYRPHTKELPQYELTHFSRIHNCVGIFSSIRSLLDYRLNAVQRQKATSQTQRFRSKEGRGIKTMTTEARVEVELNEQTQGRECSNVDIWDTEYHSPRETVGLFRDAVRNAFMPWTPDLGGISEFSARVESSSLSRGYINRLRVTPHRSERTASDVRCSSDDCLYVGFDLAGSMQVDQGGQNTTVRPGDLLLTRSDIPKGVAHEPGAPHQALILVIPKHEFLGTIKDEKKYTNFVISQEKLIRPLSACLSFLSERFLSASHDELSGMLDAVISLLPIATGSGEKGNELTSSSNVVLLHELMHFIDTTISNPDLNPRLAAGHLGISPRYVHKLFAGCGVTFSSFVMAKRLDHIRQELLSPSCRKQSIAALAYRWGFEDLSTFNRAYKHRFNCTPSQSRQRGR